MDTELEKVKSKPVYKPSSELLYNWQVLMAINVVNQWVEEGDIKGSIPNIMEGLDLLKDNSANALINDLNSVIEKEKKIKMAKSPESCRTKIEEYFFNEIVFRLQDIGQDLRVNTLKTFREEIYTDCQQANPKRLLEFIKDLSKKILSQKNRFEVEKNNCLRREAASSKAFFSLASQMDDYQSNSKNYSSLVESVWKALEICIEAKFQVELYTIYIQALNNIIIECHSIYDSTTNSLQTLNTIKRSLSCRSKINVLSVPIFTHLKRIDSYSQRCRLEIWVGQSINYWGNAAVSWKQIEAKLLENVELPAMSFYRDFQHYFIEHSKKTENFD